MSEQCTKRGPITKGRCSKTWWNEHQQHHSLDTDERWTDSDADRIKEAGQYRKMVLRDAIWDLVIADMRERDKVGVERYGKRLTGETQIDSIRYAYEEALDLACYLRKMLYERDGK